MGCGASSGAGAPAAAERAGARPMPGDEDPQNYTIVGLLGQGNGARVYLCERHNAPGDAHCAMKVRRSLPFSWRLRSHSV